MWYCVCWYVFFFKQKTAYEMRISDWSSDVCSSGSPAGTRREFRSRSVGAVRSDRRSAGRTLGFGEVEEERLRRSSKGIYHFEIAVERRSVTVPQQIGRAHVCPVTNAHLVCRLLREKNNKGTNDKKQCSV